MKRAIALLLLAVAVAGCKTPASSVAPSGVQAGDLRAEVSNDPDPAIAGPNSLLVTLRDAKGGAVDGAKLELVYDMPAMGAMPEMTGRGETEALGGGKYRISYQLPMGGDWGVVASVSAANHPAAELRMRVSTNRKGVAIEGAGAPMTVTTSGGAAGKPMSIGSERLQKIGVRFGTVETRPLSVSLRAPGRVEVDERQIAEVAVKYEAYVEKLFVGETGKAVKAGDPLLSLYSPDLLAAEEELLQAERGSAGGAPGAAELLHAARNRLRLWDLSPAQIDAIQKTSKPDGKLTVPSPANGVVLEKTAVAGLHVMPGTTLYRIGNLGHVWVQADLFEFDAPFVEVGQPASMVLPSLTGAPIPGRVAFVAPTLDEQTRTLRARLEFSNAAQKLKPGMFADVRIEAPLGERLAVPDRALLLSGEHRYAFVDRGEGHLQAVEVVVGAQTGEWDEVRSGLAAGDRVAMDGTFLLSSEAQLRDALPKWSAP